MAYRHEWKHVISPADLLVLRQRLPLLMEWDPHATGGEYLVRSLYFDNAADTILREKLDGVNVREKFRLRYYNGDPTFLRLEKKSKINGLCLKQTAPLSPAQAQALLSRELNWMKSSPVPLHRELYDRMLHRGLRPKTVVDYTREPFVFAPGHVRVTLDYNLRTAACCADFSDPACLTLPVGASPIILKVKWDEYLPDIIRDAVQLPNCRSSAFSKYAQCRIYG